MSFQDVGKPGGAPRRPNRSQFTGQQPIPENQSLSLPKTGDAFAQLSDGILTYQRNVGILERISQMVGTKNDGKELEIQYETQVHVLEQLGEKLETQLKVQELQLETLPRTEAAKKRATHVKLTRDYRRVQATFKNITLDVRRKRAQLAERQKHALSSSGGGDSNRTPEEEERIQLEMQLQQDRLNEEIMREREEEIRGINRGMHQVNEIYKDLAHIVGGQQEQIDQIETQMEDSKANAEQGLTHIHKANAKSGSQCTIS